MTDPLPRIRVIHPITRMIVGGAQENTLFTAARLDPHRYQVEIVCGPQTGTEGSLIGEARERGIPLTILPNLVRQVSPLRDLSALSQMTALFRRSGSAIVHTHSSKAGILGRQAAFLARVPVVIHTVHGWSFHDYLPRPVRELYILTERRMARTTDALIAVSDRDIHKGLDAGIGRREQYHRIRSAIPLEQFDPDRYDRLAARAELNIPEDAPVLGTIGRFSPQKNPLDWVRVAARVARSNPRVRFLLVGDGPLRAQVEALIAREGISGRSVLTGLRRDVGRMLAAMDVFLLTSLWEGLPRVIPEAMAMRLPVVATGADGNAEAVRSGVSGFICQPGDLEGLAAGCIDLLNDPGMRIRFGTHARQMAIDEFNLDDMIRQIEDLYAALLEEKGIVGYNRT